MRAFNPFSFREPIARIPYILWIVPLFFAPHAFVWIGGEMEGFPDRIR